MRALYRVAILEPAIQQKLAIPFTTQDRRIDRHRCDAHPRVSNA